jgi:cytochrome b561
VKTELQYGATAKVFHWSIVTLLVVEYFIGWFMPDLHGKPPGSYMVFHMSVGTTILALMVLRLIWRLGHPVAPESSLPAYQRVSSEAVHWLLYLLVLLTTLSGWLFASGRGYSVDWFYLTHLPMLTAQSRDLTRALDGWHQIFEWTLLGLIGVHILAALAHLFYYKDGVMRRMLPGRPAQ